MIGQSRWAGLPPIVIGNLVPLALVLSGHLDLGDLVLVYLLEFTLALLLFVATSPWRTRFTDGTRATLAFLGIVVICAPLVVSQTLSHVSWDGTTWGVVAVTLISSVVGTALATWRRPGSWRTGAGGGFLWRSLLLVVALVAAGARENFERLQAAGWEPSEFGNGWALPAGELLARIALALDVTPLALATGALCVYRLLSEFLFETWTILKAIAAEADSADR